MTIAYVLISCDLGFDAEIVDEIKQVEGVKEVRGVYGAYDIVVKLESANADILRDTIIWKIRKLNRVRSTVTLIVPEKQE